jgi:hypothetical protein
MTMNRKCNGSTWDMTDARRAEPSCSTEHSMLAVQELAVARYY